MEFFLIYLLIMLDSLKDTLGGLVVAGGACILLLLIFTPLLWNDVKDKTVIINWSKRFLWAYAAIIVLATLVPTTKQFAVIIGGGAVWQAVTSDKGKEVAGKIGGALESKLYQYLNEEPEKQEKK